MVPLISDSPSGNKCAHLSTVCFIYFPVHFHRPSLWLRDKIYTLKPMIFLLSFSLQLVYQAMNLEMIPFLYPEPDPNEARHLIHGTWLCWGIPLKDRDICLEEPGGSTHQIMVSLWGRPWMHLNYFYLWFFYRITCQSKTYSERKRKFPSILNTLIHR